MGIGAQHRPAQAEAFGYLAAHGSKMARRVEEGMREDIRSWKAWPEIETEVSRDALLTICPRPFAIFNNIFCNLADERRIAELLCPFSSGDLPVLWWIFGTGHNLELDRGLKAARFVHAFESTMMAASLREEPPSPRDPDIQTREVSDDLSLDRWIRVMTRVFEFPKPAQQPWKDLLQACHFGPNATHRHFIASWKNLDVGCASAFVHKDSVSLSNVGVLPGKREAGIGSAVTAAALNAARQSGCKFATLLSTKAARSMYERLGFESCGRSDCYVWTTR